MRRENRFQSDLIAELKERFPGCFILKNDSSYIQGIPDLLILYGDRWAMLECKRSETEHHQPNQDWYISRLDEMSYASFIFPENRERVISELEQAFKHRRKPRLPMRK